MINSIEKLQQAVDDLLPKAGVSGRSKTIALCAAGGNNRIYKVETDKGVYVAKHYFSSDGDTRDRLGAEFSFLSYSQSVAPGVTPEPLACDRSAGIGLYEFFDGSPFTSGEIQSHQVKAAINFFKNLNKPNLRSAADTLPVSSEGCFSILEHIDLVDKRIRRLLEVQISTDVDRAAHRFFEKLENFWKNLKVDIAKRADELGLDQRATLIAEQRCVSPCDFGFHNAIKGYTGETYFIDFEYAGWDDPSRVVADFFCQLAVPVPAKYYNWFVNEVMSVFPKGDNLIQRAHLLMPVYRIKWCCIVLNIFHPVHLKRRKFANQYLDETKLKKEQLIKAEKNFELILEGDTHGPY